MLDIFIGSVSLFISVLTLSAAKKSFDTGFPFWWVLLGLALSVLNFVAGLYLIVQGATAL
jgi:hypothetical protein